MKLNIYENQKKIAKTYEVSEYDIMYGTVEDVFHVLEEVEDLGKTEDVLRVIMANREKLDNLLMDIFGATKEELRHVKVKELVGVFADLFEYVMNSFQSKN